MELARQSSRSEFLNMAAQSLLRAQNIGRFALPMVSLLLAQAEASIGRGKARWERNLRLEWSAWPAGTLFSSIINTIESLDLAPCTSQNIF
jgi:superkiller protein 3